MSNIKFPIAIISGIEDRVVNPIDCDWTYQQLKKNVVYYEKYKVGHIGFAINRDMDFFSVDSMAILNHYNGKCQESTLNS